MSSPLQPLTPERLYRLADRIGSAERKLFDVAFSRTRAQASPASRPETYAEKQYRFMLYRQARIKAIESLGLNPWSSDISISYCITKEKLDDTLQERLREPPSQRYQRHGSLKMYHPSTAFMRGVDPPDNFGCDTGHGCVPDCPYLLQKG